MFQIIWFGCLIFYIYSHYGRCNWVVGYWIKGWDCVMVRQFMIGSLMPGLIDGLFIVDDGLIATWCLDIKFCGWLWMYSWLIGLLDGLGVVRFPNCHSWRQQVGWGTWLGLALLGLLCSWLNSLHWLTSVVVGGWLIEHCSLSLFMIIRWSCTFIFRKLFLFVDGQFPLCQRLSLATKSFAGAAQPH